MTRRDYERLQTSGVTFGDWKLLPCEGKNATNWELCHRHAVTRGDGRGAVQWNRLGRFYQCNTLDNAIRYAADCELKAKSREAAMGLLDALEEYRDIVADLKAGMLVAMGAEP